jgi:hypothetical protein
MTSRPNRRRHPCRRASLGCRGRSWRKDGCCSIRCRNLEFWAKTTPEERTARARVMQKMRYAREINRMLQRVKVLADTEDERLILAWRHGKYAGYQARHREQKGAAA